VHPVSITPSTPRAIYTITLTLASLIEDTYRLVYTLDDGTSPSSIHLPRLTGGQRQRETGKIAAGGGVAFGSPETERKAGIFVYSIVYSTNTHPSTASRCVIFAIIPYTQDWLPRS
jgi:hypothetical protein